MIGAVTFDFWGTLYGFGDAVERRRERRRRDYAQSFFAALGAGVTVRQIEYALDLLLHDIDHLRETSHVALSAEEIGLRLGRTVAVRLEAADAERLGELLSAAGREEPPAPLPGAREVLEALRGRVRLGLISDTGFTLGHDLYAVMEADGIAQLMEHFTFSNQTGTTKPEVRQFHHTLHRLGCRPEESVHVGDLEPTDVAGAKAAGMRTVRIVHHSEDPATAADASVGKIADVLDVLRGWGLDV